jgi:hypothetical protein
MEQGCAAAQTLFFLGGGGGGGMNIPAQTITDN